LRQPAVRMPPLAQRTLAHTYRVVFAVQESWTAV